MFPTARQGFRLIEVLVLLGIVLVAIGLFLPSVRNVRIPAERMKCANNLKQIGLALSNFHEASNSNDSLKQYFPTGCMGFGNGPEERLSWMVALLPYVEEQELFAQ